MKTFNESDLITWFNCDKAEIGKEYYCDTDSKIADITDFAERWNESGYKFFED